MASVLKHTPSSTVDHHSSAFPIEPGSAAKTITANFDRKTPEVEGVPGPSWVTSEENRRQLFTCYTFKNIQQRKNHLSLLRRESCFCLHEQTFLWRLKVQKLLHPPVSTAHSQLGSRSEVFTLPFCSLRAGTILQLAQLHQDTEERTVLTPKTSRST